MEPANEEKTDGPCCGGSPAPGVNRSTPLEMVFPIADDDEPCCGGPTAPPSSPDEKPGYQLCGFVDAFHDTVCGRVPQISTTLSAKDRWGTILTRSGIGRNHYSVSPGLYSIGAPDSDAPVVVTANYKLTFDVLRQALSGITAWVLVLDTRGVNVWCAAGKGTFSTQEVVNRVKKTDLQSMVSHRKLILPQLSATGVNAKQVKKECGFKVHWGPVHVKDIRAYLKNGNTADQSMRRVTFTLKERVEVVPVELSQLAKPTLIAMVTIFILSGIGQNVFSFGDAISRGSAALAIWLLGILSGAVMVPVLLPYLPGRAFSIKGAIVGTATGAMASILFFSLIGMWEALALMVFSGAVSSHVAMNFTGSTPFTSPTGVEKEMRVAIPIQLAGLLGAVLVWVGVNFTS